MYKLIGKTVTIERDDDYYKSLDNIATRKTLLTNSEVSKYNSILSMMLMENELMPSNRLLALSKNVTNSLKISVKSPLSVVALCVDEYFPRSERFAYTYICKTCGDTEYAKNTNEIVDRGKLCLVCLHNEHIAIKKERLRKSKK